MSERRAAGAASAERPAVGRRRHEPSMAAGRGRHRGDPPGRGGAPPPTAPQPVPPRPTSAPGNVTGSAGWAGVDAAVGWRTDTGPFGYWRRDPAPGPADTGRIRAPGTDSGPDWDWWNDTGTGEWPTSEWTRVGRTAPGRDWRTGTGRPAGERRPGTGGAAGAAGDRRPGTGGSAGAAGERRPGTGGAAGAAGDRRAGSGGAVGVAGDWRTGTPGAGAGGVAPGGRGGADGRIGVERESPGETARGGDPSLEWIAELRAGMGPRRERRPGGAGSGQMAGGRGPGTGSGGAAADGRGATGAPEGDPWDRRTGAVAAEGTAAGSQARVERDRRHRAGPAGGSGGSAPVGSAGVARDWPADTGQPEIGTREWPDRERTRVPRSAAEHPGAGPGEPRGVLRRRRGIRPAAAPAGMPRLLAGVRSDGRAVVLDEHLRRYGPLPRSERGDPDYRLLRMVGESRLRGRGGAGFPVEAKMRAVLEARGRPVVVANGAAGDPLTEKDAFLLTRLPHLVLDGAQVAAAAVDARQILLYVVGRPQVYGAVERAVTERRRARVDAVPVKLVPAPDRYVAGESSAAAHLLSGGPALPAFQPPHTAERGVRGRPTLVQNVETLANLALLARYGAGWFRGVGSTDEPGSLVITVRGAVPQPVVVEVPVGTTVEQALAGAGWLTESIGAVQVGGCFGRWLPAATALPAPLSHAGMLGVGGTLGAGVVIALADRACGLSETAELARYLAGESAGQCGACVNGLPAIAAALTALAQCRADGATVQRLHRWCGMVAGRGACRHPDGVAGVVASALGVFADDVGRHLAGWCGRPLRGVLPVPTPGQPPRRRELRA